jgi:hypothetical protein
LEFLMNLTSPSSVQAATSAAQSNSATSVNVLVLKKALDVQASTAMQLLQALPQPALQTEGALGTQVNTYA